MGVHPRGHERNVIGRQIRGPAMLQIWEVPPSVQRSGRTAAAAAAQPSSRSTDQSASAAQESASTGAANTEEASEQLPQQETEVLDEGVNCRAMTISAEVAPVAKSGSAAEVVSLPRMVMGICSDGGLVWDCKWRPTSAQKGAGGYVPSQYAVSFCGAGAVPLALQV